MASKVLHFSLDISKLKFVLKVLRFHKFPEAKWFDFGLNLGLLHPTLEAIESAHRANPSRCLTECLTKWLTKADDNVTTVGPITWQTLANALREMELTSIADNIHKTMADPVSEILQCFIGRLAQVVLSEESVDLLHTEGVVSKATSTEVKSCGCFLVGNPMLLILRAVAEDHNKLCTLASILMKSKEVALLANEMITEYGKSFPSAVLVIPPCEQASTSVAYQNSSTTEAQPQVTTSTDAAQSVVEVILHPGHKAEFDRMGDLLGTLIDDIAPLIEASIPSLDKFKTYLGRCRRELKLKLKDADSFDDVMEVIEGECSIINIAFLETIVSKYSIQDAADEILAYQTHLDEFCENNLTMFCNHQFKRLSSSLLICETIKFVLKWNPSEHSFSDIKGLLWKTFKDNQVKVVVIEEGNSIIVTCYAPHYLMESLLLTARENLDVLKEEMGLISLTIGYFTVYDQHVIDEEVRSLMKKLEMVENEKNNLLEEIAILKDTDSQKQHSKKMTKAMKMEIEQLRSSLQNKTDSQKQHSEKMTKAMLEIEQLRLSLQNKTGYHEFPKNYHDDDWHDGGRRNNEDGGGNWRQRDYYDGRGRAHQRANEYTDDNNDGYGRERYEEQGRGGEGRGYGNQGRKESQQKQQRIEPLIKPEIIQTDSMLTEEIEVLSQRLAESLSCCNTSDSHELIELLVTLVSQSGASDIPSLPIESLGSFSVTFQPGETVKPVEICLELVVEPLNGKSFTVYPQVTTNDTIEKLKLDVQKNYKIPKECQYWVVGSQLAEDKQTVADLDMIKDTTVYVYVQHPHKAKVHKNAMREVESQSKKPTTSPPQHRAPPSQQNASPPRRNVPPPGGYPLEQPGQSLRARQDPPNEEQAVFRGAVPMLGKAPPVGGIRVMPAPQRSDHAHKVREIQPLPVAVEEVQQRKSPSPPPPPPSPPGWDCPSCTFKNLPYRPGCEVCNGPRPDDFLPPPNYMPTEAEKKFMNNNDQELRNFLELERKKQEEEAQRNYAALLNTDAVPVVLNEEEFDCPVCYVPIDPGDGIRLRGCLHMVCKNCLKGTVVNSENAQINCPECNETISEREIREVLSEQELESYFGRGLREAEATDPNSFHCKTADCPGFCFYEDEVNEFRCQNCGHTNCILCKAQHEDMNCQQYQDDLKLKAANDEAARETQKMLEDMVAQGEAMNCPQCKIIVKKKVGPDWIRCVMCKTEICWATKGPRWGPKGRGDITGGCKCGVNGARCHPNCRNCH